MLVLYISGHGQVGCFEYLQSNCPLALGSLEPVEGHPQRLPKAERTPSPEGGPLLGSHPAGPAAGSSTTHPTSQLKIIKSSAARTTNFI